MAFQVKDAMSSHVTTISPDTTVDQVLERLLKQNVSGLPVVDDTGRLIGVITEYDLLKQWIQPNPTITTCQQLLKRNVITVAETDSLLEVADLLLTNSIRRVPVLRDGLLVGILTRRDLLRYMGELRNKIQRVTNAELLRFASRKDISVKCRLSIETVQRAMDEGLIPVRKQGDDFLLSTDELETLKKLGASRVTKRVPITMTVTPTPPVTPAP